MKKVLVALAMVDVYKRQILDEAKVAQFGDFVGGVVGTLLAFVAAILYYVALKEQRKDIAIKMCIRDRCIAANHFGYTTQILEYSIKGIILELTKNDLMVENPLFHQIEKRQTNRSLCLGIVHYFFHSSRLF